MNDVSNRSRIARALRLDLTIAVRHLFLNALAGSALVPRPLRWLLYRAARLDVRTINVFSGARITGSDLSIGKGTFINHEAYLDAAGGRIVIGEHCHLGPQVTILTASHELDTRGGASKDSFFTTTTIGDKVWLGARALVLPGAVVESGCVIAAGAVVTGRCEPGGVYAGVPARRIRDVSADGS
ncbi:MAG TPA: acyltransferase [Nocardioidaceae bacterium]|nr:acyltransferase [Nocardioidaceae bacterium]